jgi:hypothetical protein
MQDALDRFDAEADQIIATFVETQKSQDPPALIYHYTDDSGLQGILEKGKLWLTDIFSLNDPSELNHGFTKAVEVLDNMVANGPAEGKAFAKTLSSIAETGGIRGSALFFVCSFSLDGDDLGQWRAYADNGRGYALGLDLATLKNNFLTDERATPDPDSHPEAFRIVYNDAALDAIHREIIEKMLALISLPRGRNMLSAAINSYMETLSVRLMTHAIHASLFFKHRAYENEKEYRFVETYAEAAPPVEMKLRRRPYSLIRYKEFDWRSAAPNALRTITVGPAANRTKASQFAKDCLRSYDPQTVPITNSSIPYRVD